MGSISPPEADLNAIKSYVAGHLKDLLVPGAFDFLEGAALCFGDEAIGKHPGADREKAVEPEGRRGAERVKQRQKREADEQVRDPVERGSESLCGISHLQRIDL